MLKILSRSISGHKLPDCLVQERTFEDFESTPGTDKATSRIIVAEDIYQAMIASNKEPPGDDNEEEEEASDSDSDEPAFMDWIEFLWSWTFALAFLFTALYGGPKVWSYYLEMEPFTQLNAVFII